MMSYLKHFCRGSFGCVRIAWSNKCGTKFVIKDVNIDLILPDSKICVENEMNILSQLQHPHIVKLVEVFIYKSNRYMVRWQHKTIAFFYAFRLWNTLVVGSSLILSVRVSSITSPMLAASYLNSCLRFTICTAGVSFTATSSPRTS